MDDKSISEDSFIEVGFDVTFYNARLRRARQREGLSQKALGEKINRSMAFVQQIERMRRLVRYDEAASIAIELGEDANYLFPEPLRARIRGGREIINPGITLTKFQSVIMAKNIGNVALLRDMTTPRLLDVAREAESDLLIAERNQQLLNIMSECLKSREIAILSWRFGLNGGRAHTLEEVGQHFGVTRDRIRQIEDYALQRLRWKYSVIRREADDADT